MCVNACVHKHGLCLLVSKIPLAKAKKYMASASESHVTLCGNYCCTGIISYYIKNANDVYELI